MCYVLLFLDNQGNEIWRTNFDEYGYGNFGSVKRLQDDTFIAISEDIISKISQNRNFLPRFENDSENDCYFARRADSGRVRTT